MPNKKSYRTKGKKKSANRIKGNAKPYESDSFRIIEKELLQGFPVTSNKIMTYRDMIKSISAQVLYKGIKNYIPNFIRLDDLFFKLFKPKSRQEMKDFYDCFYDLFYKRKDSQYEADISHYHKKDKDSVQRAIADIRYILDNSLIVVFRKLDKDYNYYKTNNAELREAIDKLKNCYEALNNICSMNEFLFLRTIPSKISQKKYNDLRKTDCKIEEFYKKNAKNEYVRSENKTPYVKLGYAGALYFAQTKFEKVENNNV